MIITWELVDTYAMACAGWKFVYEGDENGSCGGQHDGQEFYPTFWGLPEGGINASFLALFGEL